MQCPRHEIMGDGVRGYFGKTYQLSGWRAVAVAFGLAVLGIFGLLILMFASFVGFLLILGGWLRRRLLPPQKPDASPPIQWSSDTGEVRDIEVTEVIAVDHRRR